MPVTVSVNDPLPSGRLDGDRLLMTASGFGATTKSTAVLVPPPGVGLVTVTGSEPAVPGSAGTTAESVPLLFNVVINSAPLKLICDEAINPVPVTVNVNEGLPTSSVDGERLEMTGDGLFAGPIVNVADGLVPPPGAGLTTVTATGPVTSGSDPTVAVSVPLSCSDVASI